MKISTLYKQFKSLKNAELGHIEKYVFTVCSNYCHLCPKEYEQCVYKIVERLELFDFVCKYLPFNGRYLYSLLELYATCQLFVELGDY